MTVPQLLSAVPLVRLEIRDATPTPEAGRYYQDAQGGLLLCLGPKAGGAYFWFIDAEDDPIIVRSASELVAAPLTAVDLIPTLKVTQCLG